MEKTIKVNIGSQAFTFDTDAYVTLKSYLDDIEQRLAPELRAETLNDIESRMAELFREKTGNNPLRVVTLSIVREVMLQMGAPSDFGEPKVNDPQPENQTSSTQNERRLYRSRTDRSIAGVCGGVAHFLGIDPTLLRIVTLLLIFLGGLSIWVYILLWIIIPEEPLNLKTSK